MINAWSITHGDKATARQLALDPPNPHFRLERVSVTGSEIVGVLHAWQSRGTYRPVSSLAQIADRDVIRDRDRHGLFLDGSGIYKLTNTVVESSEGESRLVVYLTLTEPISLG